MRIVAVGCNHRTAPLAVRERIAFNDEQAGEALRGLRERFPDAEAALLSTCNRVELYVVRHVHGHPRNEEAIAYLAEARGLDPDALAPLIYRHADEQAAAHLMRVASSLDSMVLGETQVLGQVRTALRLAQEAGSAGPILGRLFQDAIATARRVHSETALSQGRVSIASVAVQFARQIFDHFSDKCVLMVGAGKMGEQTLAHLRELGPAEVLLTNRSVERAEELCRRCGGVVRPFEKLPEHLARADIVVTSTGSPEPIIGPELLGRVMKARRFRPIFLIDIAVPRDVDDDVSDMRQVYLYNIDDLQRVVESNLDGRVEHRDQAERIVNERLAGFMAWLRSRSLGPTIAALRRRLQALGDDEIGWLLPKLNSAGEQDRELIEQFTHRLIGKLMHEPIRQLNRAAGESDAGSIDIFTRAVLQLFDLRLDDED